MKKVLLLCLYLLATPAFACSCVMDGRTLEQRIDDADRVLRVRVVGAELTGELNQPEATWYEKLRSERIVYRLRNVETLKGDVSAPPRLVGQAGDGGGDCTVRLPLGTEIILFVERGQRQIAFNYCSLPFEGVESVPEVDMRLLAIREFVRERASIHDCENLASILPPRTSECEKRRSEVLRAWQDEHGRSRAK